MSIYEFSEIIRMVLDDLGPVVVTVVVITLLFFWPGTST